MSRTDFYLWAAAGAIACAFLAAAAAGAPVRVPGTKVSIEPPEGFSPATLFPGFERADLGASIMVTEMPAPVVEVRKAMTKEGFAAKGMTLIKSWTEKIGGNDVLLLHASQRAGGLDLRKWMVITGDQRTTIMVVGIFPSSAAGVLEAAVKRSLLTVSWTAGMVVDHFEGLLFRVDPSPKLKIAGRISNGLILTESGTMSPGRSWVPLYIVASSIREVNVRNLRAFSEAHATQTAQTKDVRNFSGREVKIDGLEAYELVADAKDSETGMAMRLYQVIALERNIYFIFIGLVSAERALEFLPEFRRVTATFRRIGKEGASRPGNEASRELRALQRIGKTFVGKMECVSPRFVAALEAIFAGDIPLPAPVPDRAPGPFQLTAQLSVG